MKFSSKSELDEYESRLNQPVTEEDLVNIGEYLTGIGCELSGVGIIVENIRLHGRSFYETFRNDENSLLTPLNYLHHIHDNKFESLYKDGDYIFYYNRKGGLSSRVGIVLIDGKSLVQKHWNWDSMS